MLRAARLLAVLALITMSLLAGPSFGAPVQDGKSSYDQGIEFFKKGQYDQAIASFTQAIQASPKNAVYYNSRGLAYYDNKNLDKAIADYNKAIHPGPEICGGLQQPGFGLLLQGRA